MIEIDDFEHKFVIVGYLARIGEVIQVLAVEQENVASTKVKVEDSLGL